jgi:hypothetical protein
MAEHQTLKLQTANDNLYYIVPPGGQSFVEMDRNSGA